MNSAFSFNKIRFKKYHYTDNRKGASFNYIALMIKGRCKIVSDCGTIKVNEGDFFFIPINLSYQSYWYDNNEIEFLSFGFTKLDTSDNLNFDLQKIGVFKDLAEKASKIPIEGNDVTLKTLGMFCSLFAELIPHMKYADGHKEYSIIKKAKNFILENPDCNMKAVAGHCNISEPYLYIVFKNAEKTTPNNYKQNVLCSKAAELLNTTDKSVEEISTILGFSSASYFRKVLKKHTGKTPREIRKNKLF